MMDVKDKILALVTNEFALNSSPAWKAFLTHLKGANCNLADFQGLYNWGKFHAVGTNAHAG